MGKQIVNAVAGSGKTTLIIKTCREIGFSSDIAIITYTIANQENLNKSIIEEFGFMPKNIHLFGYFEFLYRFCYLPYSERKNKGICFEMPHFKNPSYYTGDGRIYSNKLAKYILQEPSRYINRISKYFEYLFLDEIQDLTADDFDWMLSLVSTDIFVTGVGDFYQSTFASSIRGNKNKNLYSNYGAYKKRFEEKGFDFDDTSLSKSYRCNNAVCSFIRTNLNIEIYSTDDKESEDDETYFISNIEDIERIMNDDSIKKLFYQKHYVYKCNSDNWGNSKGCTFSDVCVVLNNTTYTKFKKSELCDLAPATLSKFYVACSRTKGRLYFIEEKCIPDCYKI